VQPNKKSIIAAEIVFIVPMMPSNMGGKQKQKQKQKEFYRKEQIRQTKLKKNQTMGVMNWKLQTDKREMMILIVTARCALIHLVIPKMYTL